MVDRLINIYAVIWAIGYLWFVVPIRRWYRRHRRDADYFTHLGWRASNFQFEPSPSPALPGITLPEAKLPCWKVGLLVGLMLILWGLAL